jgi:hypothetical protein
VKDESNSRHRLISKIVVKAVDFAVLAILMDVNQDFTLGVSYLPAWHFGIKISRTFLVNIFRTIH